MIVWERQSWEANGGFERLTLWSDGRSEVVVAPLRYDPDGSARLRAREGWEMIEHPSPPHVEFVRKDVYPADVARRKLTAALAAGIHRLRSFGPGFVDGGGVRVVIQANGQRSETIIPMFTEAQMLTPSYKGFSAVSEVLDGFDTSAYEVVGR